MQVKKYAVYAIMMAACGLRGQVPLLPPIEESPIPPLKTHSVPDEIVPTPRVASSAVVAAPVKGYAAQPTVVSAGRPDNQAIMGSGVQPGAPTTQTKKPTFRAVDAPVVTHDPRSVPTSPTAAATTVSNPAAQSAPIATVSPRVSPGVSTVTDQTTGQVRSTPPAVVPSGELQQASITPETAAPALASDQSPAAPVPAATRVVPATSPTPIDSIPAAAVSTEEPQIKEPRLQDFTTVDSDQVTGEQADSSMSEVAKMTAEPLPTPPADPQVPTSDSTDGTPATQTQQTTTPPPTPQKGITTLDLDEGNWFLKRQALERTMNTIEQINVMFTKILDTRMTFLTIRNKVDRDFDVFAKEVGFEMGDINQILTTLIANLEAERKNEGQLSEPERELLAQMEKKLEQLKQLRNDVTDITELDATIDDVLMQVEQEIDKSHTNQMQSWRNFQSIKKVLNDEKAEELALKTEGLLNNMNDIFSYINGQLITYFNKRVQMLQDNMAQVKVKLNDFKTQETNLKTALENFATAEQKAQDAKKQEEKEQLEEAAKKIKELEKPKPSFLTRTLNSIREFWASVWLALRGWVGL